MTTPATRAPLAGRLDTLTIDHRTDADGKVRLTPRGELVRGCADVLAGTLADLPGPVRAIEAEMSAVVFMDTAGLAFLDLLEDHGRRYGVPVSATGWTGQPCHILRLVGLDPADPLRKPPSPPEAAPGTAGTPVVASAYGEQLRSLCEELSQLRHALASRPVIDQARGVLMARHGCTAGQAWDILRVTSQLSNTKLRAVAAAVVARVSTGAAPPPALRRALGTAISRHAPRHGASAGAGCR